MFIDVLTPTYVAHYLQSKYGAQPYQLELPGNSNIKSAFLYWDLAAYVIPPPAEVSGTLAIVRLQWPEDVNLRSYKPYFKYLEERSDCTKANIDRRNFFYKEFWLALDEFVGALTCTGMTEYDAVVVFMNKYNLMEEVIHRDSLIKGLFRMRKRRKKPVALSCEEG